MIDVDILVIGAGPAGLAAAIAARENGIDSVLVLEREEFPGGILRQCIHTGFGLHRFNEELTGPEYAMRDVERANELGVDIQCGTTVLSLTKDREVRCVSSKHGYQSIKAKAVILAMGCRERPRGAMCIPGTRCAGIYTAGTAQRFVNLEGLMPGRKVMILGSGDIGLIMARRLTLQGARIVACVEIMPYSSGLNRNIVQCLEDFEIPLLLSHTVIDIKGRDRLSSVTVVQVDAERNPIAGTEVEYECDTLLLSCGLIPENELSLKAGIKLSSTTSGAVVDEHFETSVEGIFACGNVLHVHDLVDYVSNESFKAGRAAAEYVKGFESSGEKTVVENGYGVRGVVPQLISSRYDGDVEIMFRPTEVFRNGSAVVEYNGQEIMRKRAMIFTPGEMVVLALKSSILKKISGGRITVHMERGGN